MTTEPNSRERDEREFKEWCKTYEAEYDYFEDSKAGFMAACAYKDKETKEESELLWGLVKAMEWGTVNFLCDPICPMCFGIRDRGGHKDKCALNAVLRHKRL